MPLEKRSGCKVNLLLNILGKRPDGFHELETLMHPVGLYDRLTFEPLGSGQGIRLTCDHPGLPVDASNLVHRAATLFLSETKSQDGVGIHLEKHVPMAAGLGGGSANAATVLLGMNEMTGHPLSTSRLQELAASLGSDVPFFLQDRPALATGRGEIIRPLDPFPAMDGAAILLARPGFGVATAWAYRALADHAEALRGKAGRADLLVNALRRGDWQAVGLEAYNALEAPVFVKYPVLAMVKEYLLVQGAGLALMSGSGSTVFGVFENPERAREARDGMEARFGRWWTAVVEGASGVA